MKNKVGRIFFVLSYTPCREDVGRKRVMASLIISFGAETASASRARRFNREEEFPEPTDRSLRAHIAVLSAATAIVSPCSTGNDSVMPQFIAYFGPLRAETKCNTKQQIEAD
jgi:hypothetical protein